MGAPRASVRNGAVKGARSRPDRVLLPWLGLGLLAYYGLTLSGHHYSIDGILMFQSAKQLLFHQTFILDPPVRWGPGLSHVSPYGIGFSLAYFPALALLTPFASRLRYLTTIPHDPALAYNPELYSNLPYLLSSWTNPLITAGTGCLVFTLARRLGLSQAWAVAAGLAFGIASPAAVYARFDFAQPLAALTLTAALVLLVPPDGPPRATTLAGAGLGLGAMVLTRPDLAILAPWAILWVFIRTRRIRDGLALAVPIALTLAMQLALNWARFGNPLRTGYPAPSRLFPLSPFSTLEGIAGLLVGPSHGMLVFFPLAWLGGLGLVRLLRAHPAPGSLWTGLLVIGVAFYGAYRVWWAGWSWGPRFLLPLVPLLSVAAAFWASTGSPRRRFLFLALAALGIVVTWNGILVDFVTFGRWVERTVGPAAGAGAQFRPLGSPLLGGWALLSLASPDLLWVHLWQTAGGLARAPTAGLVALLGVSAYRLAAVLGPPPAAPGRGGRRRQRR